MFWKLCILDFWCNMWHFLVKNVIMSNLRTPHVFWGLSSCTDERRKVCQHRHNLNHYFLLLAVSGTKLLSESSSFHHFTISVHKQLSDNFFDGEKLILLWWREVDPSLMARSWSFFDPSWKNLCFFTFAKCTLYVSIVRAISLSTIKTGIPCSWGHTWLAERKQHLD